METRDVLNADNGESRRDFIEAIRNLSPVTDNAVVMDYVRAYLDKLPKQTQTEVEECIGVFLRTFTLIAKTIRGGELQSQEIEALFMGETLMLDLNNNWYRQMKPILEPVVADSKVGLLTIMMMRKRPEDLQEDDDEVIKSLAHSAWDFIPWILFTATGNIKTWISAKEIMRRMIIISPDHFGV